MDLSDPRFWLFAGVVAIAFAAEATRFDRPGTYWLDTGVVIEGDCQHIGPVGFEARNDLMQNAAATIVPTLYIEPFGGVAVEAMLAGCPVVASDWGAFSENVTPDVGARFRTPIQGAAAVAEVQKLNRKDIRRAAKARFSQEAVGPLFTRWFDSLDTLWERGYDQ